MGIAPCAKYGIHRMKAQGNIVTKDYNTKKVIKKLGNWFKFGCGDRFICEGSPDSEYFWPIYSYCTEGAIKSHTMIGGVSTMLIDSSLVYYTESNTLDGYNFRY